MTSVNKMIAFLNEKGDNSMDGVQYYEAANMLETAQRIIAELEQEVALYEAAELQPAVPQEPVGYVYWEKGHAVGALNNQTLRPGVALYAAPKPQQPRLTDAEILEVLTNIDPFTARLPPGLERFARAIEKKVLGEV